MEALNDYVFNLCAANNNKSVFNNMEAPVSEHDVDIEDVLNHLEYKEICNG